MGEEWNLGSAPNVLEEGSGITHTGNSKMVLYNVRELACIRGLRIRKVQLVLRLSGLLFLNY